MNRFSLVALTLAAATMALPAAAQFQKPEDAIKYRQAVFTVMGTSFGRIGAMTSGKAPFDAAAAASNAEIATMMSKLPYTAFIDGTASGDTKAKPEIWSEPAKFKAAAEKMQIAMADLNVAAKSGNEAQIKTAFGATGQTCKACHDDFKAK
ncbi:MAG: cytochrome c [Rubrivivax sp.]